MPAKSGVSLPGEHLSQAVTLESSGRRAGFIPHSPKQASISGKEKYQNI